MGFAPIFLFPRQTFMDLAATLEKTLTGLGFELVHLERAGNGCLRVFIDRPGGITVENCAFISEQLSRLFAVEDVDYERLEVSSPGLDRPLTKEADFTRFTGAQARVQLRSPIGGQRKFVGVLRGVADGEVLLDVDGELRRFALADLERARLVPQL
jgi:ribosome maturation factor RimP